MLTLLSAATATNSAPSGATAGVDLKFTAGTVRNAAEHVLYVDFAGTGALSVTLKLWGYSEQRAKWYPMGTVNDASAITATTSGTFAEVLYSVKHFDRVYLEVTAISGTSNTVNAYLGSRC